MWEDYYSLPYFYLFFRYVLLNAIVLWAIFVKHLFPLQRLTVGIIACAVLLIQKPENWKVIVNRNAREYACSLS